PPNSDSSNEGTFIDSNLQVPAQNAQDADLQNFLQGIQSMKQLLGCATACGALLAMELVIPVHAASTIKGTPSMSAATPFAEPSRLPYALPPCDRIHDADYLPAFDAGMEQQRREVDAIAHNSAAATFENTVLALERSGQLLQRVSTVFFNLNT